MSFESGYPPQGIIKEENEKRHKKAQKRNVDISPITHYNDENRKNLIPLLLVEDYTG